MIELGKGWKGYLDSLRLAADSNLIRDDENIGVDFAIVDGGGGSTYVGEYVGLSLIGGNADNRTADGGTITKVELSGAGQTQSRIVDGGTARMERCADSYGRGFYDGGGSGVQPLIADASVHSDAKPTGTLLNSMVPLLAANNQMGGNGCIARSESRALKSTDVYISVGKDCVMADGGVKPYVKKQTADGREFFEMRVPVYFSGVCNFYNFKTAKGKVQDPRQGSVLVELTAWGFVKDNEMVVYGKNPSAYAMKEDSITIGFSAAPNIIKVQSYTI